MMPHTVALIDYGAGNVRSMSNALAEAARREALDVSVLLTKDPDDVLGADRIVLPGVGAFAACARGVHAAPGLHDALRTAALIRKTPFLGVCVGMQLLADVGLEHGEHAGFGWIAGDVDRLRPDDSTLKVPHMGWNRVVPLDPEAAEEDRLRPLTNGERSVHPVFGALTPGAHVYFVHSYAFDVDFPADAALMCDYGGWFVAAVAHDNILGVQFHPEKSQAAGLALLGAFLRWRP